LKDQTLAESPIHVLVSNLQLNAVNELGRCSGVRIVPIITVDECSASGNARVGGPGSAEDDVVLPSNKSLVYPGYRSIGLNPLNSANGELVHSGRSH